LPAGGVDAVSRTAQAVVCTVIGVKGLALFDVEECHADGVGAREADGRDGNGIEPLGRKVALA